MLVDPVTVAAASPTPELKMSIIKSDGYGTERRDSNNAGYRLVTQHSTSGKGARHYLQLLQDKNATDPNTGLIRKVTASVSLTINVPSTGFDNAAMAALAKALTDYRDDSEVTTVRLLNFES